MRRISIVALALLALAGAGCGGEDEVELVRGDGYEYELPDGWKHRSNEQDLQKLGFAGYVPDTLVTADPEEGFADNVNVLVEHSLTPGISAREYAESAARTLRNPEVLPGEAGRVISDLDPRDFSGPKRLELDGADAYATDYTGDRAGRVMRFRNIVALREGTAYGITYTALRHRFEENADAANRVVDTWAWR